MKKAIVLTYAPLSEDEKELIRKTDIYKIATNFSAVDLGVDLRLTADNIVDKCLECDCCSVVSLNYDLDKERVINAQYLPKRHTSLVSCVDYLYLNGFTHILLIATNPQSATYKLNIDGINSLKDCLYLYKYTKDGNLDIPFKPVKEFIMENLTDEQRILGVTAQPKKLMDAVLFTDATRYEVHTQGRENKSIETGKLIGTILPPEYQQRLLNGENEIIYNGTCIKRITRVIPEKQEIAEPVKEVEPVEVVAKPKPKAKSKTAAKKKTTKK
jgi:hypothetical protein